MDNRIINGKEIAKKREVLLKEQISKLSHPPHAVSILIGDDPASVLYTKMKKQKAEELGINFEIKHYDQNIEFDEIKNEILRLNDDKNIDGIMVQLPVKYPELIDLIKVEKDFDGLTGKDKLLPAVVKAILIILEEENIDIKGKKVAVLGRSKLIGQPVAEILEKMGADVKVGHSQTPNLSEITKGADLIITAVGKPGLLTGDMVKQDAVVIDVGTDEASGKLVGDVDFKSVYPKASKITPVPGGIGPLTIIALMENVVELQHGNV